MHKKLVWKNNALSAGLVLLCGICVSLPVSAAGVVPIPSRKPVHLTESHAGLADMAMALLQFGKPPVPKAKPMPGPLTPLSEDDAAIYKRIFAYQETGDIAKANTELLRLRDFRLRGYILYQRYMHPSAYKTSYEELRNWLALYADYPGAGKIYKMASKRQPEGESDLRKPEAQGRAVRPRSPTVYQGRKYVSARKRTVTERRKIKEFTKAAEKDISKNFLTRTLKGLEEDKVSSLLDPVEKDLLKAKIAARFLYEGDVVKAYQIARESAGRSGVHVPMAGWIAGLSAWRMGQYKKAAPFFEMTGRSPYASGWISSAGAYWAARSHMRTGNVRAVSTWLERSAHHQRTFYGLISTRALGRDFSFNWDIPNYTKEYREALMKTKAGARATLLVSAQQAHLAEAELLRVNTKDNKKLREALLSYAGYAGLPGLAMRLGSSASDENGGYYDAALYPTGPWKPKEGYKVDPALIHAIMRQESRFDPTARSRSGARGLMQVMPGTARHVAGKSGIKLDNPETNLDIGQRYLEELMGYDSVGSDLFALLIAYNAGPGNLAKWKRALPSIDDPLLFVESIPSGQTREYIERVLSNYWIYRLREDLSTPTLDAVAAGKAARYAAQHMEGDSVRLAASR